MLDLVFLILMLIVLINSVRGDFYETLCNVATVVGIVAAITGLIMAFINEKSSNTAPLVLNIIVFFAAIFLRRMARQFVKLHEDKERADKERMLASVKRFSRDSDEELSPVYNDENFDDPELRFGKGGYTDNER